MKNRSALFALLLCLVVTPLQAQGWLQWGNGPAHRSSSTAIGQSFDRILAEIVYDPFAPDIIAATGSLGAHYQAPIVDRDDVIMTFKTGEFTGRGRWETQIWNVKRLSWNNGSLGERWSFETDWKPVPFGSPVWEPVFHPALDATSVYLPGAGGTIVVLDRFDGSLMRRVNPFGLSIDISYFVTSPLTVDHDGNIIYNAMRLDPIAPWGSDALGAWIVRVSPDGTSEIVSYDQIVLGAPSADEQCLKTFLNSELPWPPSPDAVPGSALCGSQRPGINVAPAVGDDGTIYTVSRAHFNDRWGYLVAVNPNLTSKWSASLRDLFNDGCGVLLPPNGSPGGCREGARIGVDPADNTKGAGQVSDNSSASPTVAPDGTILYGTLTRYNHRAGHLVRFSATGSFLAGYRFGWDATPSIWEHDETYSILMKENHYAVGSYCGSSEFCPPNRSEVTPDDPEQYLITQLDPELNVEWQYRLANMESCERHEDGSVTCVSDHSNGFDWCVSAGAVDASGVFYAKAEDGVTYAIGQGGVLLDSIFLRKATGAAYTALTIGRDGLIYTENIGRLFVLGQRAPGRSRGVRR